MKLIDKTLFLLLLPLSLGGLAACKPSTNPSIPSESESEEELPPMLVNFYSDYNHVDESKPYYTYRWYDTVPLEEIPPTPECPTPGYPVFLGWSKKPIIDDKADLWNFETDAAPLGTYYLALYGIWVAEGEI